jgi:hypothetical protein
MRQIISTKYHSVKQMRNMAFNLREKFDEYCAIDFTFNVDAHVGISLEVFNRENYKIYRASINHIYCKSWQELIQKYHEMIEEI